MKIFGLSKISAAIAVFVALAGIGLIAQATWTASEKSQPGGPAIPKSATKPPLKGANTGAGAAQTAGISTENAENANAVPAGRGVFEYRQPSIDSGDNLAATPETALGLAAEKLVLVDNPPAGSSAVVGLHKVTEGVSSSRDVSSTAGAPGTASTPHAAGTRRTTIDTASGSTKPSFNVRDSTLIDLDVPGGSYPFASGVDAPGASSGTAGTITKIDEKGEFDTVSSSGGNGATGDSPLNGPTGTSPQEILSETAATEGKLNVNGKTQILPVLKQRTLTAMVPEPATLALFSLAFVGLLAMRRRKPAKP